MSLRDERQPVGWIPNELNPDNWKTALAIFDQACSKYSEKPAFSSFGQSISYGELNELSDAFAAYLQNETNLKPGDRIAVQLPNLLQYPVAVYGAWKAGLVVVNTNPLYTPREMEHQFKDSGAKALVIYQCMAHNAEQIIANTGVELVLLTQLGDMLGFPKKMLLNFVVKYVKKMEPPFSLPAAKDFMASVKSYQGKKPEPVELKSADTAVLQYTGGTTGVAKGAQLTHANLVSNTLQGGERISLAGEGWSDAVISPLPLYHIYAFTIAQAVIATGGMSVLIANPRDIPGFVKALKKAEGTTFLGLNTLFIALCRDPGIKDVDFSALKVTASGGMALTHAAAELWESTTGCPVTEGYGLTETSPIVSFNPPGQEQIGTIGPPLRCTEVKIIDLNGADVTPGEPGELCVRGPQVMAGYWERESATQATMTDDGYFRTGDIAVMQDDGYMRIVDRAKDMIIVSGFNVYPNEVEDIAASHPSIVECAAIGVPDEVTGEYVKLFAVRSNDDLTQADVRAYCKKNLTPYKVPKEVEFVGELPKSNVGKVLRRKLKNPDEDI